MIYKVTAKEDGQGYLKVVGFERVEESPVQLCDFGTEALFIDSEDHTNNMTLRINCVECSDFMTVDGNLEVYMAFDEELPAEMDVAFEKGQLFLSEL